MHTRTHNWFLVMIALALAVAPLRGAWAISMPANADSTSHCAQMDIQTTATPAGMQQQDTANESGHICDQNCNGTCCGAACTTCVHGASSVSDIVNVTPELHDTPLDKMFLASFPERTVIPPLRPPTFLHS